MIGEADDDWDDVLVTSWAPKHKKPVAYISKTTVSSLIPNTDANEGAWAVTGITLPLNPVGQVCVLYGKVGASLPPTADRVAFADHALKGASLSYPLQEVNHRLFKPKSTIKMGFTCSKKIHDIVLHNNGNLKAFRKTVFVKNDESVTGTYKLPSPVNNFIQDRHGIVYLNHNLYPQIRELKPSGKIVKFTWDQSIKGFCADEEYIFYISTEKVCHITRQSRRNLEDILSREMIEFSGHHFQVMNLHRHYVFVCLKQPPGTLRKIKTFVDFQLLIYSKTSLDLLHNLTITTCPIYPRPLQNPTLVDFFRMLNRDRINWFVPIWSTDMPLIGLEPKQIRQLRDRTLPRVATKEYDIIEILVFPFKGDENTLVIALRDKRFRLFLVCLHRGVLLHTDSVRLFEPMDDEGRQGYKLLPKPTQDGFIALGGDCRMQGLDLKIKLYHRL